MEGLPEQLRRFFWDVDFERLSITKSSYFIISRLMEDGDEAAFTFLLKTYSKTELTEVLKNSRYLSGKSREFWRVFLELDEGACTPRSYPAPYGNS
jgi:hypothetical protein